MRRIYRLLTGLLMLAAPTAAFAAGELVEVWATTGNQNELLAPQAAATFGADTTQGLLIEVNESHAYQTMEGFGAAMTDSSAWLMANALSPAQRTALLSALFDSANGIGLQWVRLPMGASDFALSHYSYDDMPAGQTDPTLASFSISHDLAYIIPVLLEARAVNPDLRVLASPWSAPGWMKDSDSLVGGRLLPQYQQAYADYFAHFLQDYAAAGVAIDAVTVQNESHNSPADYPGMWMEVEQQLDFVANQLGPAVNTGGLSTRIFAWDHNWNEPFFGVELLDDPGAGPYTDGTAFHCYGGEVGFQTLTHELRPDDTIFFTECSSGAWSTNWGNNLIWDANTLVIGVARNWGSATFKWNLALDTNHGPHTGGCTDCNGIVTIDETTGGVTFNHDYYALGQAARFVDAGASRIASTTLSGSKIETVAFKNPDGSKVLYVTNDNNRKMTVKVRWGGQSFPYSLLAKSVVTFKWSGTQGQSSVPGVPTGLTALARYDSVRLGWDVSLLATSYDVERATAAGGPYTTLANVAVPFHTDSTIAAGTTYFYRVKANNTAGTSASSSSASATPGPFDAFAKIEAEDFTTQHGVGVETTTDTGGGLNIGWADDGDFLYFPQVDFGDGASEVQLRFATESNTGTVEIRLDDPDSGALLASVPVSSTGGWTSWATLTAPASGASGVESVYVVFTGADGVGNLNYLQFTPCTGCGGPGGGDAMHVGDITMSWTKQGPGYKSKANVWIADASGQPVATATVTGSFSGASSSTATKSTDSSGHAIMDSTKVNGGGTWTFCVDDVVLSGWTYDSAANIETCDSVTAP